MDQASPNSNVRPTATAWPLSAQLTAAFLLGVGSTLLSVRLLGHPTSRPTDLVAGPAVDLNRASRAELLQLPGIGAQLANRIVDQRTAGSTFGSADDLRAVPGVGKATLERIRPYVATDLPSGVGGAGQLGYTPKPLPSASPLDLNAATAQQLQTLPGIGAKMAERILAERAKRFFASVDELRRVGGIGPKTLEKLRPFVKVDPPTADGSRDGGQVSTRQ